ncbi:MAG: AmmeMemoRadiSam system protein A [Sulfurimonas sp.]
MIDPILLRIAKTAILSRFDSAYVIDKEKLLLKKPFLKEKGAVFVTLNYVGKLRGCIGSILPHQILIEDVIQNAQSAAFSDPRFQALNADEFDDLTLEVSLLTPPTLLEYSDYEDLKSKIRPYKDGLILKYGDYSGTFLPQVWEQLPEPEQFLEHLSYKANANPTIYKKHPDIFVYQVEAIKEDFNAILPI